MGLEITISNEAKVIRDDKKISMAVMASFVILTAQYFVLIAFNLINTSAGARVQSISKIVVGLVFIYALPSVLKRSKFKFVMIYLSSAIIFVTYYIIFPENRMNIENLLFPFFFMSLPAFVYSLSIIDFTCFKAVMMKTSHIVFAFGLLISVLVFSGSATIGSYSMSLSYYMLLPTIMFLDELNDRFSLKMFVLVGTSMLIILSLGSRGAVLCIAIFIILKFIRPNSKRTYKKTITRYSVMSIGIIALLFADEIIMFVYTFLQRFGINSRTLALLLRDNIHLSGRDILYNKIALEILERPFFGIGLAGDRQVLGGYAHNFIIEVMSNYGVIIGAILSVIIVLLVIQSMFTNVYLKYNLAIIWLCIGFVHLMVSSSYLIDLKFWVFLGVMIGMHTNTKSCHLEK